MVKTTSPVLLWPSYMHGSCNSLLGQILTVYRTPFDISGDSDPIEFGDVFSRIQDSALLFVSDNAPLIASTIGGRFESMLSLSPIDGAWFGAILLGDTMGAVTSLPTCGDWYAVDRHPMTNIFELYHMIVAELLWIGFEAPYQDDVLQIGCEMVLVSPRALSALGQNRTETVAVESADGSRTRRVVVDWTTHDGVPTTPWLRVAKSNGTDDLFSCVHVGADGKRL